MYKVFFATILAFTSCSESRSEPILNEEKVQKTELNDQSTAVHDDITSNDNSEQAKRWLESAIKEYFDQELNDWSFKYEVTEKKTGVGFLIGAQDYYNIVIKTCNALPSGTKGEYLFELVICDTGYDQCFGSDVTVIEYNDSYAIDDVKEYYK